MSARAAGETVPEIGEEVLVARAYLSRVAEPPAARARAGRSSHRRRRATRATPRARA